MYGTEFLHPFATPLTLFLSSGLSVPTMEMAFFFLFLSLSHLPLFLPAASALTSHYPSHHAQHTTDEDSTSSVASNSPLQLQVVREYRKPPTCSQLECPGYIVIHSEDGYEIRKYNSSSWISTASPILDVSFSAATRDGFFRLFDYIDGSNTEHRKIAMTAPVLTTIAPSSGPVCASTFTVRFFFADDQADSHDQDPPSPEPKLNLKAESWSVKCFAVRRFSGFASDENVPVEAFKLHTSLSGSPWAAISKQREADEGQVQLYIIAQYNSPFQFIGRVNEVWFELQSDRSDCQLHHHFSSSATTDEAS